MQRQVPRIQTVLKTMEVPINQVTKHAEFPHILSHRQGCCRYACGDAATGPSVSDCVEDSGKPDCAVHRQRRRSTTSQFQEEIAEVVQLFPGTSDEESDEGSSESEGFTSAEAVELRYLRQRFRDGSLFAR